MINTNTDSYVNMINTDAITQISTVPALTEGILEVNITIGDLSKWGNFGMGGTAGLKKGFIILDNQIYSADVINITEKMCFGMFTFFIVDKNIILKKYINLKSIREYIDSILPTKNIMYAIRIDGHFKYIKTANPIKHDKPYPRITPEICNKAINFEKINIKGSLIGFWLPEYLKGVNDGSGGLHVHFLSEDKAFNGHVIDCYMNHGDLKINYKHNFNIALPQDDEAFYQADLTKDRTEISKRIKGWLNDGIGGDSD